MIGGIVLLAALTNADAARPHEFVATPFLRQELALQVGGGTTTGGAGGGLGAEVVYRDLYLAEAEVGALWLFGNVGTARLSLGMQRRGVWSPAGWITTGVFFGDRVELLSEDGTRPPVTRWNFGIRGSPLRFVGDFGIVSVLEPGIAIDFTGAKYLSVGLVQAGARW